MCSAADALRVVSLSPKRKARHKREFYVLEYFATPQPFVTYVPDDAASVRLVFLEHAVELLSQVLYTLAAREMLWADIVCTQAMRKAPMLKMYSVIRHKKTHTPDRRQAAVF